MRDARRIGAFFSGLLLYCCAIGIAIVLSGIQLPQSVYTAFGGRHSAGVVFGEASVIALLLFLMAVVWGYFTVRPRARSKHATTSWCLAGLGLAWLGWLIYGTIRFATAEQSYQQSLSELLLSSDVPPLWGLFNVLAVVSGAVVAGILARKLNPRPPGWTPASTRTA